MVAAVALLPQGYGAVYMVTFPTMFPIVYPEKAYTTVELKWK